MSNKKFDTLSQFRKWANLEPGDTLTLPFGSSKGWSVTTDDDSVEITSDYYRVAAGGQYGAAMIHGHTFPYGGHQVSGVIEFGLDEEETVVVTNRRRVTSKDTFDENTQSSWA